MTFIRTISTDDVSVEKEHSRTKLSIIEWGEKKSDELEDVKHRIEQLVKAEFIAPIVLDYILYPSLNPDVDSIVKDLNTWQTNRYNQWLDYGAKDPNDK